MTLKEESASTMTAVKTVYQHQSAPMIPRMEGTRQDSLHDLILNTVLDAPLYKEANFSRVHRQDHSADKVCKIAFKIAQTLEIDPLEILKAPRELFERVLTYYVPVVLWLEA